MISKITIIFLSLLRGTDLTFKYTSGWDHCFILGYSHVAFTRSKRTLPANLPQSNVLSEIGEHLTERYSHFLGSPHKSCGGQSGTGTSVSPSTPVFPVTVVSPLLHTYPHLTQTNGESLGIFKNGMFFREWGSIGWKTTFHVFQSLQDYALYILHAIAVHPAGVEKVSKVFAACMCNFKAGKAWVLLCVNITWRSVFMSISDSGRCGLIMGLYLNTKGSWSISIDVLQPFLHLHYVY